MHDATQKQPTRRVDRVALDALIGACKGCGKRPKITVVTVNKAPVIQVRTRCTCVGMFDLSFREGVSHG